MVSLVKTYNCAERKWYLTRNSMFEQYCAGALHIAAATFVKRSRCVGTLHRGRCVTRVRRCICLLHQRSRAACARFCSAALRISRTPHINKRGVFCCCGPARASSSTCAWRQRVSRDRRQRVLRTCGGYRYASSRRVRCLGTRWRGAFIALRMRVASSAACCGDISASGAHGRAPRVRRASRTRVDVGSDRAADFARARQIA